MNSPRQLQKTSPKIKNVRTLAMLGHAAVFSLLWSSDLAAQCAMCRTALTNSVEGQRWAHGINAGILMLLLAPFLIAGGIAIGLFRHRINSSVLNLFRHYRRAVTQEARVIEPS